jgi:hypothetical protein
VKFPCASSNALTWQSAGLMLPWQVVAMQVLVTGTDNHTGRDAAWAGPAR